MTLLAVACKWYNCETEERYADAVYFARRAEFFAQRANKDLTRRPNRYVGNGLKQRVAGLVEKQPSM
jgi:hypothetical protein